MCYNKAHSIGYCVSSDEAINVPVVAVGSYNTLLAGDNDCLLLKIDAELPMNTLLEWLSPNLHFRFKG